MVSQATRRWSERLRAWLAFGDMGRTANNAPGRFIALAVLLACLLPTPARAAFNNSTPRGTFAGTHNYVVTGNTLRTQSNAGNACLVGTSSNATVSGIPAGSTIMKAYLYWGGSGTTPDPSVNFGPLGNVVAVSANEDFDNPIGDGREYFGGVRDVTSQVTGNGTYQFGGLTVDTSNAYCSVEAVVAGWALVVVYSNPSEAYRYTRVYDGLQFFRGSSVTTTQSGFRVPDLLNGKVTVVTWEGDEDAATSVVMDGYNETLTFDGYPLLNAGCDQTNNIYNSTISAPGGVCSTTSYGVDIDTYDVTNYLYEGQTGATLEYSSGNDRVFLTAQVISTTNTPVADLGLTKTHSGNFTAGQNGNFSLVVHNYGPEIATGTATVTDTLPAGLSFVSGTGTGWSCSAVGQVVTCNNSAPTIAIGADLPTLTLTVAVAGSAGASVQNTATVSHPMFDGTGGNQTAVDTVTILRSNLSTSTKTVTDLNGGDAEPGDTLRYTITLKETGGQGVAATGVSVLDDLAANIGNLSIVSIPAGATDNSVGSGGANGTGQVNVSGITVAAGGTATIVFDVSVSGDANPGDSINNTATIANGSGPGATPAAPPVTVAASQAPTSGNKILYVYDNQLAAPNPRQQTTRTPQTTNTSGTNYIIVAGNNNKTWPMTSTVATGKSLVLPAQTIVARLYTRAGNGSTGTNRATTVTLLNGATVIATSPAVQISGTTVTARNFSITIPATTINAGSGLNLRVNNGNTTTNREVWVYGRPTSAATLSTLSFTSDTVVNVDDVSVYSAAYPAVTTKTSWNPGDIVYIRADISDPFGGYDVSSATLLLKDGNNTTVVNGSAMTAKTSPTNNGTPNRIFEYAYTIPANPNFGTFTAAVTGNEGSEGTVSHTRNGNFDVAPKALTITKSHTGDFTAGANNSYTLTVANTGGTTVTGTTTVKDTLATGLTFVSGTGTGWTCSAVGQVVTCTSSTSIPASSNMAPITLTVAVAGNLGGSVNNQASVGNSTIGAGFQKDGNTDTAIVLHPDLSTSTKSVLDVNGGDANPGDTLRYTITVKETAGVAANSVTVTDTLQTGLTGLAGLNAGLTTCTGTPSVVSNTLTVSGLTLGAGATCVLVFDVTIANFVGAGFTIDNSATISNPNGSGATPAAPTVTVSASQQAVTGNKVLYVYSNNTMTRVQQAATGTNTINEGSYQDFTLGAVANPLTIVNSSTISISLLLQRSGNTTTTNRTVYAQLLKNGTAQIGTNSNSVTFNSTTLAAQAFTITAPASGNAGNLQAGDTLVLRVYNNSGTGGNPRTVGFAQYSAPSTRSTVTINTSTVVHVDAVTAYSAAYPSSATSTFYGQGDVVYIRAVVSDPFGFADITAGNITIKNPSGTTIVNAAAMTSVNTSGAFRTYEYAYTIPNNPPVGGWTASVTAKEGAENTITHTGNGGMTVGGRVTLTKTWGVNAIAGNAVSLTILGGSGATAGTSTAPSTTTPAAANAGTGSTVTLKEAFTSGSASNYTPTLACVKNTDGTTVTVSGSGLTRTITMPAASVTCTWTNSKTVPLTIVKLATVKSDPINGTTNPKAIPGAIVEYQVIVTNPAANAIDGDTLVVTDPVPAHVDLRVADFGAPGSGPVQFTNGAPTSNLTFTFTSLASTTDDVAFSSDGGTSWTYVPVPGGDGTDPQVTNLRISPKGSFNANNAQFNLKYQVKIE